MFTSKINSYFLCSITPKDFKLYRKEDMQIQEPTTKKHLTKPWNIYHYFHDISMDWTKIFLSFESNDLMFILVKIDHFMA